MTDMTAIVTKAEELNNDLTDVQRELKRVASIKCRLKKMPGRKSYQEEMTAILQEEQLIKNVRDYLSTPKRTINTITQDDIDAMTYDEVSKAIRAVQSKKTHTKWAEDCEKDESGLYVPGSGKSYKDACELERKLMARRDCVKPTDEGTIRKNDLRSLLDELKTCSDLDVETCISRIEEEMEL